MAKAANAITRGTESRQLVVPPSPQPRPGWVYEVVVSVLAAANHPLRPDEVVRLAEQAHGRPIAPSSIRNCLHQAAARTSELQSSDFATGATHCVGSAVSARRRYDQATAGIACPAAGLKAASGRDRPADLTDRCALRDRGDAVGSDRGTPHPGIRHA